MVKIVKAKKMKKNIFAIFDAPFSTPLKPNIPAIRDITKNTNA
jgi:hypothetical protein